MKNKLYSCGLKLPGNHSMIPINLSPLEMIIYIENVVECVIKDLVWFINTPDSINNVFLISIVFVNNDKEKIHIKSKGLCLDIRSSNKEMFHRFEELPTMLNITPMRIDISKIHPDGIINIDEYTDIYDGGSWNNYIYSEEYIWKLQTDEIKSILHNYINNIVNSL